ncbi:response regulator [Desulfoluna spongiiphila]|uniref:histidine kinase n=1 Tax=Desulfoluna spongiiphila TaxID=419481 RepID=A0A1G5GBA4_9BACT|nr:response regulator [Desulfoluna spongiiphila]SCY48865.1 Signal transduction histidine kinase [Desulfoluna spongiiphila]VVS93660.1 pas fold-3 [Desulfoluna spongiiphila]
MTSTHRTPRGPILVIDEDASVINTYAPHLEACGYEVMTARDGHAATQLIAVNPPDLIISELRTPAMDGHSFFRHLQRRWPEIPVIVTSTTCEPTEVVACLRKGASDFLIKPLKNMDMLSLSVSRALREIKLKHQNQRYKELLEQRVSRSSEELKTTNRYLTELNRRLTEVVDSSRRLSSCVTIESFGTRLLEEFSHHLDASGGSLYIAGQEGLRLVHCLDGGHAPGLISYPVAKSSPFGYALYRKEPVLIGDIRNEGALRPSGYGGYHNGSFVIFPLQNQEGKPFGLVSLHGKKRPPFVNQDREVGGLLASYSSETLRAVRAMEALSKSEEKYKLAALTASDLISEWSPATDDLVWFGNIDAVIGSAPETRPTTMEAWLSLIHPDDRQRIADTYRNKTHCATAAPMDYRVRHLSHGWRHFRERTTTLRSKGGATKVLRACNDITREKNAEEERIIFELKMQHAQKLESLGIIAGGIAHDFNNILMAVLGHADIALEEVEGNPGPQKALNSIVTAGKRATELARQLLVYSGKGKLETSIVNVNTLVSDMMSLIEVSVSKKVRILFHPGRHTPHIEGNLSQLRQVVLNLLTNASQAIGNASGQIEIRTGKVFCTRSDLDACSMPVRPDVDAPLPEATYTFIDIDDTGCGMDATTRNKLFDPFYTTKKTGTGLGMAAVLGIIRQLRGTMTVDSTPGVGTHIRVLLPASLAAVENRKQPEAPPTEKPIRQQGGLILIADDEEPVRKISQRMVEKLGFSVISAKDGREAVSLYKAHRQKIRCVILDMTMPGLSGSEALDQIRIVNPSAKAIIASGYGSAPSESDLAADDSCSYLQKPYQISELKQVLREMLNGSGLPAKPE